MTKDEVRTQLSAYLDGELGEAERRAVEAALTADAALSAELDGLRRTAELVRSLPRAAAPAGFAERVEASIAGAQRPAPRWLRGWRPAAVAVAACLLIALAAHLAPRPDRARETARDVTPVCKDEEPKTEGAAAPAPGPSPVKADEVADARATRADKLEAGKQLLAMADKEDLERARRKAGGYGGAPTAPAPTAAERPAARAEAKSGGATGAPPAKPPMKIENKAMATIEAESAPADGRTDGFRGAVAKEPRPTAPWVAMKSAAAPAAEAAKEEAAKQDSDVYADASGTAMRKLRDPERDAVDHRWLVEAIVREERLSAQATRRAVEPGAGVGRDNMLTGRRIEERLGYADLARCLAEVQATLDAARLTYTVQPVGGGQFVVETTLSEPEARALLARLAGAKRAKGQEKAEPSQAGKLGEAQKTAALVKAKDAPAPMVHLVLRFVRAEADAAAPATLPAEPAEQK